MQAFGKGGISREFALVCACCAFPRAPDFALQLAAAAERFDWPRVAAIAARQRVEGLVADGLRAAGLPVPKRIARADARIALANRVMAMECGRLSAALERAGVDALFVKGLPLAVQAYGTTRFKMSLDIDILVALDAIAEACSLLQAAGYHRRVPDAAVPDEGLREWAAHFKETAWVHPTRHTMVDLHARLVTNRAMIPGIGLSSPRDTIEIAPGIALPTLSIEPLFVYLCVHGAETGWGRLKWIADLAALCARLGPEEVGRLHRVATAHGAGRCSAQGLLLASDLLGLDLGRLESELRRSPMNRLMARLALSSFTGRYEVEPHRHDTFAGIPILASHFLMGRGIRHKWTELNSKLSNPRDRARGRLPRSLAIFYPALGLARWSGKRLALIRRQAR